MSRATWIQLFAFLHVLGAIAAVGSTLTYGLWFRLGDRAGPAQRAFVLRSVSWIDNHLATPAFMAQAVTGVILILLIEIDFFQTAWLLLGVALYVVMTLFAIAVYAPTVKRQIALAERAAADPAERDPNGGYAAVARRSRTYGIAAVMLTLAIVYLMVVKPALWSAG